VPRQPRQKTVALSPAEYQRLREIKEEAERRSGMNFDWGAFLLGAIAGGLIASVVQDIVKEKKKKEVKSKDG